MTNWNSLPDVPIQSPSSKEEELIIGWESILIVGESSDTSIFTKLPLNLNVIPAYSCNSISDPTILSLCKIRWIRVFLIIPKLTIKSSFSSFKCPYGCVWKFL